MARIPEDELERLKAEVSLLRLVQARGVELKRHGKDWLGRCPFHADRTPSLVVSPATNLWHCPGACNVGGSVIDWVMKTEGVSFGHAVELLRNDLPHLAAAVEPAEPKVVKRASVPKLASPLVAEANDQVLLREVVDYYHETLQQSPEELAYLESRGLNHPELIATFQLGYANRTLAYRLPQKNRQAGAELRGRLQRLGVLRESGHEHLNGSLVVPLRDAAGNVVQLYGRKVNDNLRSGTAYHLYLPGDHAGVWNLDGLRGSREVILCEALLDSDYEKTPLLTSANFRGDYRRFVGFPTAGRYPNNSPLTRSILIGRKSPASPIADAVLFRCSKASSGVSASRVRKVVAVR
jgi:hypothetical protein